MYRFLESLHYQEGKFPLIAYHQARLSRTLAAHGLEDISLMALLSSYTLPLTSCKYKVRVLYGEGDAEITSEVYPHVLRQTLKMVHDDAISYEYKYADRTALNRLFAQRGSSDNILIVKGGFVTDTAYTNVILFDGIDWVTPRRPLLCGVMRENLLKEGRIIERDIPVSELSNYQEIRLINALNSFEDSVQAFIGEK